MRSCEMDGVIRMVSPERKRKRSLILSALWTRQDAILRELKWLNSNSNHENLKDHESDEMQQTIFTHPLADFAALFMICIVLSICILLSSKPDKNDEEYMFVDESNRINLPEDRTYRLPPPLNAGNYSAASGDAIAEIGTEFGPVYAKDPDEYSTSRADPVESSLYSVHQAHSQSTQTSYRAFRKAVGAQKWLIRRTRSGHIYGKYPML